VILHGMGEPNLNFVFSIFPKVALVTIWQTVFANWFAIDVEYRGMVPLAARAEAFLAFGALNGVLGGRARLCISTAVRELLVCAFHFLCLHGGYGRTHVLIPLFRAVAGPLSSKIVALVATMHLCESGESPANALQMTREIARECVR
jgi:hypothetical protein